MKISNVKYTLTEAEKECQFYFYRNDGGILGDVGRLPMDMYQYYTMEKMMSGEINGMVMEGLKFDISECGKIIRLTTFGAGEKEPLEQDMEPLNSELIEMLVEKPKGIKRLVKSLFKGKK